MPDVMPILPSWEFDETAAFYRRLGFEERGRWDGRYLIVDHQLGIELHFFASKRFKPSKNNHGVYVRFNAASEVDDLHGRWAEIESDGWTLTNPNDTEYGLREFAVLDPMRNLLRVGGTL